MHCSEILLRGIHKRSLHVDAMGLEVDYGAFLRRRLPPNRIEEYLSVNREALVTPLQAIADLPATYWALVSLHTGHVRDLGLSVLALPTARMPAHAGIFGLPDPFGTQEETERAADAAKRLRAMVRWCSECRFSSLEELSQRVAAKDAGPT